MGRVCHTPQPWFNELTSVTTTTPPPTPFGNLTPWHGWVPMHSSSVSQSIYLALHVVGSQYDSGTDSTQKNLEEQMRHQQIRTVVTAIALATTVTLSSNAQAQNTSVSQRTAWGQPDIQGIWDFRTITPFERPDDLGDQAFLTEEEAANLEQEVVDRNERLLTRAAERTTSANQVDRRADGSPGFYNNFWLDQGTTAVETRRTSLIIDPPNGKLPALTTRGQQRANDNRAYREAHPADSYVDRTAADRCLLGFNAGPPLNPGGYNQNLQIFQTPDHVALMTEMVHTVRVVPLDGRPPLKNDIQQWSGDARGYWDGDTLVVETTGFNEERRWRNATGAVTLVERFTRIDADTLEYEYTVTDPETWSSSWTASIPLRRTETPLFEYACHEGNYSMEGILGGHRAEERAAKAGTR